MSTSDLLASCTLDGTTCFSVDPKGVFSDFGDATCGEPEIAQHLILDFTPDSEIDNEISLHQQHARYSEFEGETGLFKQQTKENVVDMTKTACSMLEVVEEKGLIRRAFEGGMPRTVCSLGSYNNEDENIQQKKRAQRGRIICKCTKPCKNCRAKKDPSALKQMCTKLEQWDAKHPKSMDQPGHSPVMQHCILQKQVFEF